MICDPAAAIQVLDGGEVDLAVPKTMPEEGGCLGAEVCQRWHISVGVHQARGRV